MSQAAADDGAPLGFERLEVGRARDARQRFVGDRRALAQVEVRQGWERVTALEAAQTRLRQPPAPRDGEAKQRPRVCRQQRLHDVVLGDVAAGGQVHEPEVLELPGQRHAARTEPFRRDDRVEHHLREVGGEGRDAFARSEFFFRRRRPPRLGLRSDSARVGVRRAIRLVAGAAVEVEDNAPDGHAQQRVGGRADRIVVRRLRRPRGGGGGGGGGGDAFSVRRVARARFQIVRRADVEKRRGFFSCR